MIKCACGHCEGEVHFSPGGEWGSMLATNGTDSVWVWLDPNSIAKMIQELREMLDGITKEQHG